MSLLDQKLARARLELLLDQPEFAPRETEALGVVLNLGIGVGKEDFGRRLFYERSADRTLQDITGTLCGQTHDAVQLAPGLRSVPCKTFERGVSHEPPELVHPAHQSPAVEQPTNHVEQIQCDGSTDKRVIQKLSDIESHDSA